MVETYIKISRTSFWLIIVLILLIPVSKEFRLLVWGTRTSGEVVSFKITHAQSLQEGTSAEREADYDFKCAVIEFRTKDAVVRMNGPAYVKYDLGQWVAIIYDEKNPDHCIMPNLAYLYSIQHSLWLIPILMVWIAFYTSFAPPKSFLMPKLKKLVKNKRSTPTR